VKTFDLIITLDDGEVFEDGMDAETEEQALQLAYWNWECAVEIKIVH